MIPHVLLFALITLIACLVYYSLRADSLRHAVREGLRRFASFMVLALVFGVALQVLTRWL